MDLVTLRRENTLWSIQQNPSVIQITRTEKVETEGHFEEVTSLIGPFTVRVFKKGLGQPKEVSSLGGTGKTDSGWALIADWQADLKAGTNVKDRFEIPGVGSFTIASVIPQRIAGEVTGYQADLELMT